MTTEELKLQVELLQKQIKELKETNRKLRKQLAETIDQAEEFRFQRDCAQAIRIVNIGRNLI